MTKNSDKPLVVGLAGFGTVGGGLVRLLDENAPADGAEWTEEAVKEIKAGGGLIRESVVPPKVKMMSYKLIGELLKKLNAA